MYTGKLLRSLDDDDDSIFRNAVILVVESNEKGETGFILNKRFERNLNELEEFRHSKPFPLFTGGPIDQEHLYFIHHQPDLIKESKHIDGEVYLGGNFNEAIKHINNGTLNTQDLRLFLGYCGWDKGDLEAEINAGGWSISTENVIF
ncbi:MAG: YqgE/AlgH family protein [Citrobacter freundii]|nr:MAG: YqgE/AlgH family protein [Citrobacter freundii]